MAGGGRGDGVWWLGEGWRRLQGLGEEVVGVHEGV